MATPQLTTDLQHTLERAFDAARTRRNEHVALEHLLLALLDDPVAKKAISACGGDLSDLKAELVTFLAENFEELPEDADDEDRKSVV